MESKHQPGYDKTQDRGGTRTFEGRAEWFHDSVLPDRIPASAKALRQAPLGLLDPSPGDGGLVSGHRLLQPQSEPSDQAGGLDAGLVLFVSPLRVDSGR